MTARKDVSRTLLAVTRLGKSLGFTSERLAYGLQPNLGGVQFHGFGKVVTVLYKRDAAGDWRFSQAMVGDVMATSTDHATLHSPTELHDRLREIAQADTP